VDECGAEVRWIEGGREREHYLSDRSLSQELPVLQVQDEVESGLSLELADIRGHAGHEEDDRPDREIEIAIIHEKNGWEPFEKFVSRLTLTSRETGCTLLVRLKPGSIPKQRMAELENKFYGVT
jgi:hypothetical protein